MPTIQAQPNSNQAAHSGFDYFTPIPRYTPAYSMYRRIRRLRAHPYRYAQLTNTAVSPDGLIISPHQVIAFGRREPENLSRDSPRDRRPIQILFANPNLNIDTHLDHTLYSLTTRITKMAKSTRSKSKRAFRRHKREDGVYAATDAARLQRLSAKLAAKISADKDGDQEMGEEDTEQQVEGGGEHLPGSGYHFCGVDAREERYDSRLDSGGVLLNVAGGEENLNNQELMSLVKLDEWMEVDGHVEMEEFGHMVSSSLVYDSDGDIEMVGFEHELAHEMTEPCVENPSYERTILWCMQIANVEAFEDMHDGGSIGDETEFKLIAPAQSSLDDPEEWWEDNPLFQSEYMDPLSEAVYVYAPPLQYCNPQLQNAPGDSAKRMDYYPSLFQGDFRYESAC